jgi:hypothetical protein
VIASVASLAPELKSWVAMDVAFTTSGKVVICQVWGKKIVCSVTVLFNPFFSVVPLSQTKNVHVPLDTKNINDMQFLPFQFNFL